MYTSYFKLSYNHPDAVSIAVKSPDYFFGKKYPLLMPTRKLLYSFKDGKISEDEYTEEYFKLLQRRKVTPEKVFNDLGPNAVLLCWEIDGFCHRHLVSYWLREHNIKIKEL